MKQKEIIIIIPGAYSLASYPSWIKNFLLSLAHLVHIVPATKDHKKVWKKKMKLKNIFWMKWTRQIDIFSLWLAKKKLARMLNHYKNDKVTLVGVSLSGKIIIDVIQEKFYKNISKVVLVCSVNDLNKINFKHPAIINIYSKKDNFAKLAIDFYSPFHGGQKLNGENIKNIILPNMSHNEFCSDGIVNAGKFKGKTITEILINFLTI